MNLIVESVEVESINVSMFGKKPRLVPGETRVCFRSPDGGSFVVDWTHRGAPPMPGAAWILEEES